MNKLILLDRDGVINIDSDNYIRSAQQWQPIAGSLQAMAALSKSGYRIFIITNQSGLARGLFTSADLEAMHQKLQQLLQTFGGTVEHIYHCPHHPEDDCNCRKPKIGMLQQLEEQYHISIKNAFFVGDSLKDLLCARNSGAKGVLVRTGKGNQTETTLEQAGLGTTPVYDNLENFVDHLLGKNTAL